MNCRVRAALPLVPPPNSVVSMESTIRNGPEQPRSVVALYRTFRRFGSGPPWIISLGVLISEQRMRYSLYQRTSSAIVRRVSPSPGMVSSRRVLEHLSVDGCGERACCYQTPKSIMAFWRRSHPRCLGL